MNLYVCVFFIAILLFMSLGFQPLRKVKIEGVWAIAEVQNVKPNGTFTSTFPTESQVLFTKGHYSFCWTGHRSSVRNWQLPDSARLARLNQSIVNAGSYELRDSILTTKAAFAMNPMFVGGLATFTCSFVGDTLVLTGSSVYSSDNVPNPVYASGSHFVNKLVKAK